MLHNQGRHVGWGQFPKPWEIACLEIAPWAKAIENGLLNAFKACLPLRLHALHVHFLLEGECISCAQIEACPCLLCPS